MHATVGLWKSQMYAALRLHAERLFLFFESLTSWLQWSNITIIMPKLTLYLKLVTIDPICLGDSCKICTCWQKSLMLLNVVPTICTVKWCHEHISMRSSIKIKTTSYLHLVSSILVTEPKLTLGFMLQSVFTEIGHLHFSFDGFIQFWLEPVADAIGFMLEFFFFYLTA